LKRKTFFGKRIKQISKGFFNFCSKKSSLIPAEQTSYFWHGTDGSLNLFLIIDYLIF